MSHLLQSSSQLSCAETYAGPGPFSEPESQNIRDFVTSIHQNVVVRHTIFYDQSTNNRNYQLYGYFQGVLTHVDNYLLENRQSEFSFYSMIIGVYRIIQMRDNMASMQKYFILLFIKFC